jgi:hypothetical protein
MYKERQTESKRCIRRDRQERKRCIRKDRQRVRDV